jgi:hypothetical protein
MKRYFVIAGDYQEFKDYRFRKFDEATRKGDDDLESFASTLTYVRDPAFLRGCSDPHGVFIGSWRNRPDIHEVVAILSAYQRIPNTNLQEVVRMLCV